VRICSPQLGIAPASNLGGTVSDRETLTALAALGVDIHIPLPKNEAYAPTLGWHIYPSGRHLRYYYEYNWLFLPAALKIWRRVGFDLLRIHSPTIGLLGRLLHTISGRPTVAHYHHIEAHDPIHNGITRQVIHRYDLVTTPSQFALEQLVTHFGFNRQKGLVVYPGVDPQYQVQPPNQALHQRLEVTDKLVLLYVGVLSPRKNLRFLLDAFNLAQQREPNLVLVLVGDGPQRDELRQYAAQLGLTAAVRFAGYIAEADKVAYYNLADIFVFPSLLEGFGMAVAEAMACGVPVVSSNAASLPEVVGEAGLLASPTDLIEFSQQILRLAQDSDLRRGLGEQGRLRVEENFSWAKAARTTLHAYTQVLQS
jgi:glycosyltransferase involved in cell wall biosynthesis